MSFFQNLNHLLKGNLLNTTLFNNKTNMSWLDTIDQSWFVEIIFRDGIMRQDSIKFLILKQIHSQTLTDVSHDRTLLFRAKRLNKNSKLHKLLIFLVASLFCPFNKLQQRIVETIIIRSRDQSHTTET